MIHPGKIVLMGSGELTATMVEVHKALLKPYGKKGKAVFLDTPAGFQMNVDLISRKAVDYFNTRVRHPLTVASFKSLETMTSLETGGCLDVLETADYLFMGPGSPTYALRQWQPSPIPEIMVDRVKSGACLVTASAAALTVGRLTLPVYEIYKVGQTPFWVDGLDITGRFGLNLAVVPHWNNQEGGNHDTRFCFMGEQRLKVLEKQIPDHVGILGIDEHTVVIIDLEQRTVEIKGRGTITLRCQGKDRIFDQADSLPIDVLTVQKAPVVSKLVSRAHHDPDKDLSGEDTLLKDLHVLAGRIVRTLAPGGAGANIQRLLELEDRIWRSHESGSEWAAAREIFRELLKFCSEKLDSLQPSVSEISDQASSNQVSLVEEIIALRDRLRRKKQWQTADELRDCLQRVNVIVTDTADGSRWHKGRDPKA